MDADVFAELADLVGLEKVLADNDLDDAKVIGILYDMGLIDLSFYWFQSIDDPYED